MYTAMPLHCPWLEKEQIDVCCETETATILRERGQKLTPQRMELVTALRHADGQLTAAELLRRARQAHAAVNTSTVFRTMALLRDLGLRSRPVPPLTGSSTSGTRRVRTSTRMPALRPPPAIRYNARAPSRWRAEQHPRLCS